MTSPPETAPAVFKKPRRVVESNKPVVLDDISASRLRQFSGAMDRFADARVSPAAADVAGHRSVDVRIAWVRIGREQRGRGHDLPRLAVTALWDLELDPCALDWMAAIARETFDRGDRLAGNGADRCDARAD